MPRLRFGAFLAPHHPIGEHPMLQFRRDLDLVEQLDRLGYDEFWCGEHHSSGWEMIASPEMFLAAAGERTKRIRLATGVVSLPYHHPFNVAQRMVQLDHMTGGRAIFGSGPGALASDAHTLGIDPMVQRDRQDEAIGVIRRLLRGERVTHESDWFTLQDAALQLLPLQEEMPFAVASQISPSGMTLAGKHGIGVISIGSLSEEGLNALPTQWGFAETAGAEARQDGRSQELARAADLAHRRDAREGARRGARGPDAASQRIHRRHVAAARRDAVQEHRRGGRQDRVLASRGGDDRHAGRSGRAHQVGAGGQRRVRHRGRLRPRLGQPGKHHAQLGHGGALCRARDQRLSGRSAATRSTSSRPSAPCSTAPRRRSWPRSSRTRPRSPRSR